LGALKKEEREKEEKEIKERGQTSHSEKREERRERSIEQPKFSPKSSSFQERYEKRFLKGAKYSPSPSLHPYITPSIPYTTYHLNHLPYSLYTCIY
jgi:hypothetical protein